MKATELTLKQEPAPILGTELCADYTVETSTAGDRRSQIDVIFAINNLRIVLELEIGSHRKLLEGIGQADQYREASQAAGTITIAYPEEARAEVESKEDVKRILYGLSFEALVLTPFQRKYYPKVSLQSFVESIYAAITRPQPTDLDTLLRVLRECVENIAFQIKRSQSTQSAVTVEVVSQLDLFKVLAGPEKSIKRETLESAAADLASYIIVNQLLLYFLLSPTLDLPKLSQIDSLQELDACFKRVTDMDYQAVYRINVLGKLQSIKRSRECLSALNKMIIAFRNLKPEALPHDLLGRMFHEFLPLATRKLFATFYTKPVAAEILASLAVDRPITNALEPAAGSGTILVSIYNAFKRIMPQLNHNSVLARLYAIDIMPFAAHLAALNLTLQDLSSKTENVNVGIGNSLNLRPSAKYPTQVGLFDRNITRKADAQQSFDEQLSLPKQFDLVIMNPPFTDSRRYMLGMLGSREKAFSETQNYWAYFLSLADDVLRPGGRLAAVLPRLFFSGSKSCEVRNWLFEKSNYSLIWVVRTTKEFAFSEAASFRDFLVVLEKSKEQSHLPRCRIVYLNRGLNELRLDEIPSLIGEMRNSVVGKSVLRTADFCVFEVSQRMIRRNRDNLWLTVGFEYPENSIEISDFFDRLRQYGGRKLAQLSRYLGIKHVDEEGLGHVIPRGFEPKPKGLYSAIYIARSRKERPDETNSLHLIEDNPSFLIVDCISQRIKIPKRNVFPAIYSASYLRTCYVDSTKCDYVISSLGDFSKRLQDLSGVHIDYNYVSKSVEKCGSHILVTKRLNIVAPGTTHLAFFNNHQMVSPNTFYSIKCAREQSFMLTAWLNSIFGVLQLLQFRKETEGGYCDLLKEDLAAFSVPDIRSLPEDISRVLAKYGKSSCPSLSLQFKQHSMREDLDKAWMKWLGWPLSSLEHDLEAIYNAVSKEFEAISSAGKKRKEDHHQTEL